MAGSCGGSRGRVPKYSRQRSCHTDGALQALFAVREMHAMLHTSWMVGTRSAIFDQATSGRSVMAVGLTCGCCCRSWAICAKQRMDFVLLYRLLCCNRADGNVRGRNPGTTCVEGESERDAINDCPACGLVLAGSWLGSAMLFVLCHASTGDEKHNKSCRLSFAL